MILDDETLALLLGAAPDTLGAFASAYRARRAMAKRAERAGRTAEQRAAWCAYKRAWRAGMTEAQRESERAARRARRARMTREERNRDRGREARVREVPA